MDVLITSLKCQIASLETQLIHANQEKQKLHDTVICLSKALSSCTQTIDLKSIDEHHSKKRIIAPENRDVHPLTNVRRTSQAASLFSRHPTPESSHQSQPTVLTERQVKDEQTAGESDLIELAISAPNIANPSASNSFLRATNADTLESEANLIGIGNADVPSSATAAGSLTDIVVTQHQAGANDKPPVLDLQFRGLRTALDGPEKTVATANLIESYSSGQTLSFDEICGKIPSPDQDKSIVSTKIGEITSTVPGLSYGNTKTRENSQSNVNKSDTNDGPMSIYHFAANTSLSNHEQSSTQSSSYLCEPLSLSHGIRFKPKEGDFSTRSRVMIFNLPKGISVSTLLSKIRGGTIISCELLDTVFAYGSYSAMIRFSTHSEAVFCVDYAATTPLVIEGRKASIQLIPTPTYPLAPDVHQNIFEHGHTRCLRISAFHRIKHSYVFGKYTDPRYIEYQATNDHGDWFVRFTSLRRASALWADLQYFRVANIGGGFMPDPCDIEESIDLAAWKAKNTQVMEGGIPDWKI